ncbi:MAG: hypothetical protein EBS05_22890 [Proteobacteria bacterium]|nr:hypothetical protein [Pseudomonadota bacterium]
MLPDQLKIARLRLMLGIVNVGSWVVASGLGLYWLSHALPSSINLPQLGWVLVAVALLQSVLDFLGGAVLMPTPRPRAAAFFRVWLRGALVHTLLLAGIMLVHAASLRLTGGFGPAILIATLGLAVGHLGLLRAVTGAKLEGESRPDGTTLVQAPAPDPAFTGGITGWGRHARILMPASWLANLSPSELAVEFFRREWQVKNGLPGRAVLLILAWNLFGSQVGSVLFKLADRPVTEALLGQACWMTLWAFAGLLVLPSLSRFAVFAADRAAARAGYDPRGWITRFPTVVGEDGNPRSALQAIFYPIPSAAQRLRALEQQGAEYLLGNLARTNLYYSCATLTPLGRAVHCNVGRPALWIFPPAA